MVSIGDRAGSTSRETLSKYIDGNLRLTGNLAPGPGLGAEITAVVSSVLYLFRSSLYSFSASGRGPLLERVAAVESSYVGAGGCSGRGGGPPPSRTLLSCRMPGMSEEGEALRDQPPGAGSP